MSSPWVKDIARLTDPKLNELRIRYENARIAVDKAYTLVKDIVLINGPEARYTNHEIVRDWASLAFGLSLRIEEDLNNTLKVLEQPIGGSNVGNGNSADQTLPAEVSRPS